VLTSFDKTKAKQVMSCHEYIQFQIINDTQQQTLGGEADDFQFEKMLSGLPPQFYQLEYLHYLEGFSILEISDLRAIATGTVKSRLHQSRKQIQMNLQNSQSGEIL
jgi:DNA-directed RNA polymerase specialized sigma24 family protein